MILLGLGSNLESSFGDRFKNLELAIKYLSEKDVQIIKKSSFYETPSYPDKKKPKYINMVLSLGWVFLKNGQKKSQVGIY